MEDYQRHVNILEKDTEGRIKVKKVKIFKATSSHEELEKEMNLWMKENEGGSIVIDSINVQVTSVSLGVISETPYFGYICYRVVG